MQRRIQLEQLARNYPNTHTAKQQFLGIFKDFNTLKEAAAHFNCTYKTLNSFVQERFRMSAFELLTALVREENKKKIFTLKVISEGPRTQLTFFQAPVPTQEPDVIKLYTNPKFWDSLTPSSRRPT